MLSRHLFDAIDKRAGQIRPDRKLSQEPISKASEMAPATRRGRVPAKRDPLIVSRSSRALAADKNQGISASFGTEASLRFTSKHHGWQPEVRWWRRGSRRGVPSALRSVATQGCVRATRAMASHLMCFYCRSKKSGAAQDPLVTVLENKPSRDTAPRPTTPAPVPQEKIATNVTSLIGKPSREAFARTGRSQARSNNPPCTGC